MEEIKKTDLQNVYFPNKELEQKILDIISTSEKAKQNIQTNSTQQINLQNSSKLLPTLDPSDFRFLMMLITLSMILNKLQTRLWTISQKIIQLKVVF